MRSILIIGAGRSTSSLIQYLLAKSEQEELNIIIADLSLSNAQKKTKNHPKAIALKLDILNMDQRKKAIQKADIVE